MPLILTVLSSDTQPTVRAGKVTGASLPVEYSLERVVQKVESHHPTWSTNTPACEWKHIDCDKSGNVVDLQWSHLHLRGELNVKYLPVTLVALFLHQNELSGNFPFETLPPALQTVTLSINQFTGTPNLCNIPPMLEYLSMSKNKFEGNADFSSLPLTLSELYLNSNKKLEGYLDVDGVLKNLCYNVEQTRITVSSGIIHVRKVMCFT